MKSNSANTCASGTPCTTGARLDGGRMNAEQRTLLAEIERMKRTPGHDKRALKRLVHMLTRFDDREWDLKHSRRNDPGGRSRSPSMGRFKYDDERW